MSISSWWQRPGTEHCLFNHVVDIELPEGSGECCSTLAGTQRTLSQFNLLVQDDEVLIRDQHGVVNPRTGQRLLDFEDDADLSLFSEQSREESTTKSHSDESEPVATISITEARLRLNDREMQESTADEWFHEGCRLAESAQYAPAEEAFLTAIAIHAANPDALLHYAQLLVATRRKEEANEYWREYLRYDSQGPWADHARERLAEPEPILP